MTSSNKARRYLQNHKQQSTDTQTSPQLSIIESPLSSTMMRKFRGKTSQILIPQICVNNNNNNHHHHDTNGNDYDENDDDDDDNDNGHIAILNEFDQVLDNELKHTSVLRTTSLNQHEKIEYMGIPTNQQRSFSFALGSKTNVEGEKHDDDDDDNDNSEIEDIIPSKTIKPSATSKSSLSKETFSRLFHSLTFRSGNHSTSKISIKRTDSQPGQHPCLACQNYPNLELISKNKKRPSIFGVLVSKFNSSITNENLLTRCSVCKRPVSKSISNNDDNQRLSSIKNLREQKQLYINIKRRQSLPSLFQNLLEPSSIKNQPLFSTGLNQNLIENINHEQTSVISQSNGSLTESLDSNERQDPIQFIEKFGNKDENDNDITLENSESHDLNSMHSNDSTVENNSTQQFLHPPEEKTRSLLINVFRTRRSNAGLTSNETNMVGKQFSVSVLNLASSIGTYRRNSAIATLNEPTVEQRKHALSEENLPSMDNTYIYFNNINGQNFKEKLKYSTISEDTTLKEMLIKIFEKYNLSIETCNICLRSAPTLPLSLNQPIKHLILNDLVVTESTAQINIKTSIIKEKNEKRNSTGSAILSTNSKSTSKRLSTHCMMIDNDDNHRSSKTNRSNLFPMENNISYVRRKCDEWLIHGLPKLAQLQCSIDECDLMIEKEWQPFLTEQSRIIISETTKLQQETIYEMLSTEVSYIRQILTMTDVFMTSISLLKSTQRDGIFYDMDMEKLFSNIQDVLQGNLLFWKEILLPIKTKLQQTGLPMNPSDLKNGFLNFDMYFKSYLHYVLDQKTSAEYFKQRLARDELFQYLITWIEANFTNRLSFSDLTIKPLQRLTRYKLLLEAIQKKTHDVQQKNDLYEMIQKVATFVNRVNSKLHNQEQEERIRQINDCIGTYENISAPPELTSMIQEYNRDTMSNRLDLLQDMPLQVRGYRRQIIQQGPMKMKDSKNNQDVYCYLFSDMFLITKVGKRSGSQTSSLSTISNDGQSNRSSSNISNKILKLPIRIDRLDVREYERRSGGNTEPNTASFVALVFSEYNLIECAYLFQTNLSKQWIENIRTTKGNFQLLMEESKLKFQNLNHPPSLSSPPPTSTSISVSTNTIHQSLPSLTSSSLDLPVLKIDEINTINNNNNNEQRRSSKVESDVFKIVEQTRRNSRTDRKNFGRYFTADGTNPLSSSSTTTTPIKQISSSSTAILKRMSWNNEKPDSSLITNSFRSVHSSSGVSSTGSFLFSTDEDSSTTTSSSIPSIVPSTVIEIDNQNSIDDIQQLSDNQTIIGMKSLESSSPESLLRRTPYPSIKKRTRQQILNTNDLNSSTNTIIYESSKSIEENNQIKPIISSGNDSDYDNNQSPTIKNPVNNFLNSDELLLGDQNEIILHNDTHFENHNQQSDNMKILLTNSTHRTTNSDDSVSTNFLAYHKDPLITRRLLDIRSHLLLNTTLDATEV